MQVYVYKLYIIYKQTQYHSEQCAFSILNNEQWSKYKTTYYINSNK